MDALMSAVADVPPGAWLAIVVVGLVVLRALRTASRRRPPHRHRHRGPALPSPGEYWMAYVPFREGAGGKDRPCLVVQADLLECRVLYVTSQDRSADDRYVPVDTLAWRGGDGRRSWLQTTEHRDVDPTIAIARKNFRRYLGPVEPFNRWVVDVRRA